MNDRPQILACPVCSSPRALVFQRPMVTRGARSGRYFLAVPSGCHHGPTDLPSADNPQPLIDSWNATARVLAADLSTRRGHTPAEAAALLDSLSPQTYSQHGRYT